MDDLVVEAWLKSEIGDGSGDGSGSAYDGYGDGYGDVDGFGYGYGNGSGEGYSYGSGYGDGDGFGRGDSDGYGNGNGYGDGYGAGSGDTIGYGSGNGYGFKMNGLMVRKIDSTPTIITKIVGNIAKGSIINYDLTLTKTYIAKSPDGQYFAHGETIKKAFEYLEVKVSSSASIEDRIEMFLANFNIQEKYKARLFFIWHGKLTNSCLQGRDSFVKNRKIDLESEMSVKEFIELTKNEYGKSIIKQLKDKIEEEFESEN